MHVAHKTQSSQSWVWSTFEHVDALSCDDALTGPAARPLFRNPALAHVPNADVISETDGKRRTQVERIVPVARETDAINQQYRAALAAQRSVFRHYRLLGTQRMVRTVRRRELQPVPTHLANPLFETRVPKERASAISAHGSARLGRSATLHGDFSFFLRDAVHRWRHAGALPAAFSSESASNRPESRAWSEWLARARGPRSPSARLETVVPGLEWLLIDETHIWCLRRGSSGQLDIFEPSSACGAAVA